MPLGDSITYGIGSSTVSSYRAALYDKLTAAGAKVDYVGSKQSGSFEKPQHEGWSGYTITLVSSMSERSIKSKPNLICLMAGTNDVAWGGNKKTAPNRLGELIDKLVAALPDSVVLVATLTPLGRGSGDVDVFNNAIPDLVKARADEGKKVAVVSMAAIKSTDLKDGVHPNDAGYVKMADAWLKVSG
jgi:lysophospholipase L1-like esterase